MIGSTPHGIEEAELPLGAMRLPSKGWALRLLILGIAFLVSAVAFGITVAIFPLVERTTSAIFTAAVVLAGWIGGVRGGIAATVFCAAAMAFLFAVPAYSTDGFTMADAFVLGRALLG